MTEVTIEHCVPSPGPSPVGHTPTSEPRQRSTPPTRVTSERYRTVRCGYPANVRETLTDSGVAYVIHNLRSAAGEPRNEQTRDRPHSPGSDDQIPLSVDHQRGVQTDESGGTATRPEEHYA